MRKANGLEGRWDIDEILSTVSSDKVETRAKGLKDLASFIRTDGGKPKKQQVSDKGYHTILESLFRSTKFEIAYYARANGSSSIKAQSRLATCASLLRIIVEMQVRKLGSETVKAIVGHVCQSLPTSDGAYCDPLVFDYLRALHHLLEYKPHIENLSSEELHATTDFCLALTRDLHQVLAEESLQSSLSTFRSTDGHKLHSLRFGRPTTSGTADNLVGSLSRDNSQQMAYPQLQSSAAGIVSCLQHLASVPNAPVHDSASSMLTVLFDLLHSHPNVSTIQHPAFETINSLFPYALTSNIELALHTMRKFVALVRSFWQTRAAGLKEVLLSIFLHGEPLLPLLMSNEETGKFSADLSAVVETFRQEYCERRPKDLLLIEDVNLADYPRLTSFAPPLCCKFASLRPGAIRAEEPWSLLRISAAIIVVLDGGSLSTRKSNDADELDWRLSKRQRLTKQLDEIYNLIRSSHRHLKIYGLQVLAFILERSIFDAADLLGLLKILGPNLSDEDGTIAGWAMFATSG